MGDALEAAQMEALHQGADVLRERLGTDQSRRHSIQQHVQDPRTAFPPADLALINGPTPPYNRIDQEEDEKFEKYLCALSREVPPVHKIVKWEGNYYNIDSLQEFRNNNGNRQVNPVTNEIIPSDRFFRGHEFLSAEEILEVTDLSVDYEHRRPARELRQRYDALVARYNQLQRTNRNRQAAVRRGLPVGQAGSVEQQVVETMQNAPVRYENSLHRNRIRWFNDNANFFFEEGGPFYGCVLLCLLLC